MSYINPKILIISNPKGIDAAIAELQTKLANIPYIDKVFGRAFRSIEVTKDKKQIEVPKVYQGSKEYYTALPNDNLKSYVFFIATGDDEYLDFNRSQSNEITRDVSLIFWGNLKKINPAKDYIFTELIKADLLRELSFASPVQSINSIVDEEFSEIFKEFRAADKLYIGKEQDLMYPFAGVRINMTLAYRDSFDCNSPRADQ